MCLHVKEIAKEAGYKENRSESIIITVIMAFQEGYHNHDSEDQDK